MSGRGILKFAYDGLKNVISRRCAAQITPNSVASHNKPINTAKPLPSGTIIDDYKIQSVLGSGGFSIVYLAEVVSEIDNGKLVAIKEYVPVSIATRNSDFSVSPINTDKSDRFVQGRKLFFQEAGALSSLKHPNIVNVINIFRANSTVYMVMEYERGYNLHAYIKKCKTSLSENFLLTVFIPLLRGLEVIHSKGLLHLDIKPSNIHLRPGGNPLLLDFGAVHEIMQIKQVAANQVVTPGYSPVEQLSIDGYVGPWTDIYAIGATMRTCLDQKSPPLAKDRRECDELVPAKILYKGKYSSVLLDIIDWSMAVDPLLRIQNASQMLKAINKVAKNT